MRLPPFNPHVAIMLGIFAMSTTAILVKLITDEVAISIIILGQLLLACLILTPFIFGKQTYEFRMMDRLDWILAMIASICLVAHFMFWFHALDYTSVVSSVLFIAIHPIFVYIGTSFTLKHRLSAGVIISLCITVLGLAILYWGDAQLSQEHLLGNVLALIGAFFLGLSMITGHRIRKKISYTTYLWIIYGLGTGLLSIYLIINPHIAQVTLTPKTWVIIILLAVFPLIIGHVMANFALRWLKITTVSMGAGFEPIIAGILAYSILEETIAPLHFLSGTIVVFGLFLFNLSISRKQQVTLSHRYERTID